MKKMWGVLLAICMVLITTLNVSAESRTAQQEFTTESIKGEIIIPVTEKTGAWKKSTAVKGYDGGAHDYCDRDAEATATFQIDKIAAGNYELYYWVMPHAKSATAVTCTLSHNEKEEPVWVFQKIGYDEELAPGWVSMGVYDFKGDASEKLFYQNPNDGATRISAIRLVPSKKELTKPEDKPSIEETPLPAVPEVDLIKDTPSGLCFYEGDWVWSNSLIGPMEQAAVSLWIAGEDKTGAYVKYDPQITEPCNVQISIYLLYWHVNQTNDVKYEVYHNGKVDEFHIDMTQLTQSGWHTLGTFDFSGNGNEYVLLTPTEAGGKTTNTRASSISFDIMSDTDPQSVLQTKYVSPDNKSVDISLAKDMAPMDRFADMKNHWANYDVEFMANEGFVQGTGEGTFSPDNTITRAEFVTILNRALKFELKNEDSFADVSATEWFYPYVATAKANGLLNGLPVTDTFEPHKNITREEMAHIIYNAILQQKKNDEWVKSLPEIYNNYQDKDSVSDWAQTALQYLNRVGIIQGTSDTTISPQETATRAQATVILKRFMQQFVWAGPPTDEEWVLTFNDEFLGNDLNWDVWIAEQGGSLRLCSRWPENVEVHDGALHLVNRREERGGKHWTAASVWVDPTVFRQSYGYWEARYKIANAHGVNNSFWATARGQFYTSPDQAFEIDINEGHYPNEVCTTLHTSITGKSVSHSSSYRSPYNLALDYHTYALKWDPDFLYYYHDGKLLFTQENFNASIPVYPMLSSAILYWGGNPDDQTDGSAQIIDYVRIWQRPADATDISKTLFNQPVSPVSKHAIKGAKPVQIDGQTVDNSVQPKEIILEPEIEGEWRKSTQAESYNGEAHFWAKNEEAKLTYSFEKIPTGKYKAYAWRMPHANNQSQMDFLISQNGEDTYFGSVAMKLAEGQTAEAGWVLINEAFEVTDTQGTITHKYSTGTIRNVPIKFVPIP